MKIITTTNVLLAVLVALVAYSIFFAGHVFGAANTPAASGVTFGDAKIALVAATFATNAGTSTSILNTDGSDRIVKNAEYWCSGLTTANLSVAALTFSMATTSTNSQGLQGNTNYVLNTTVATSTSELWVSSTTPGLTGTADYRRWPANTYLTINSNASTTGTACVIGVTYNPT